MIINKNNYSEEILSATSLLLSISKADDNIDNIEIDVVKNIIKDFFEINTDDLSNIITISLETLKKSTDFSNHLKNNII